MIRLHTTTGMCLTLQRRCPDSIIYFWLWHSGECATRERPLLATGQSMNDLVDPSYFPFFRFPVFFVATVTVSNSRRPSAVYAPARPTPTRFSDPCDTTPLNP